MSNLENNVSEICIRCKGKKLETIKFNLLPCSNSVCNKYSHFVCFQNKYQSQDWFKNIEPSHELKVFCNKTCYTKARKEANIRLQWDKDGKDGLEDPNNSMRILIEWLTTGSNWLKYKGKNNNGKSKMQYAKIIASLINKAKVKEFRTGDQVRVKIDAIEKAYKDADKWVNNTGAGVKAKDESEFEDYVRNKKCSYYFELEPIFRDHASINPPMTSDDLEIDLSYEKEDADSYEDDDDDCFGDDDDISVLSINSKETQSDNPTPKNLNNIFSTVKNTGDGKGKSECTSRKKPLQSKSDTANNENEICLKKLKKIKSSKDVNETVLNLQAMNGVNNLFKAKQDENDAKLANQKEAYKMQSIENIEKLRKKGYSKKKISNLFPELLTLIDIIFDED